ncbi:hypothetical protein [Streptomyces sp. ST2-7A]|uniref:hypothetical protein n=1 Tax=Streptomyces sp. ST2-7A TaxID=2907214 RepID=UPI001F3593FD|nr:hypothetical protein [Streptomyces sp. ST2-7A]MCE7080440.1 hypothetical protein [Streptomyces sp. ST2-7A]
MSDFTHLCVLTMEAAGGRRMTFSTEVHLPPGMTRGEVFVQARDHLADQEPAMARGVVLFFDVQPLAL